MIIIAGVIAVVSDVDQAEPLAIDLLKDILEQRV
jgi:hypothetical protein